MKAGRNDLMDLLAELHIKVKVYDHEPVFSVSEAASLRDQISGGHTKNLFLKDKKGHYFLVTVGDHAKIDLKTLHQKIDASGRLSFGSAEKLDELLGLYPGAVSPVGAMNDHTGSVSIILDQALMENAYINVHPMVNEATIHIARDDLVNFLKATGHEPRVIALSERE